MNMMSQIAGILLGVLTSTPGVAASGQGKFYYGPEVSENYACHRAEQLAKADAIRTVLGENIFVDEYAQCREVNNNVECKHDFAMYSMSDVYIKKVTSKKMETYKEYGRSVCSIDLDVIVTNDRPKIDAHVDARFTYKAGEEISFKVKTNQPTKVYIFFVEGNQATMMWPTYVGTNNSVANELTVPTPGYKFTARASKNKLDESMVFVFTNEDMKFMRNYNVEDLNSKLLSIPISERRIIRRNLVVEQ